MIFRARARERLLERKLRESTDRERELLGVTVRLDTLLEEASSRERRLLDVAKRLGRLLEDASVRPERLSQKLGTLEDLREICRS